MTKRIQQIIELTKTIIQDCSLQNGGIYRYDIQVSVSPLLWSHSMFIIASKELNFI